MKTDEEITDMTKKCMENIHRRNGPVCCIGMRFNGTKLVLVKDLVEEDKTVPADQRTMKVLKKIGNTIFKCVQFSIDCPSQPSGSIPQSPLPFFH